MISSFLQLWHGMGTGGHLMLGVFGFLTLLTLAEFVENIGVGIKNWLSRK